MARNRKILFAKCAAILTTVPVLIYAYSSGPNPGYSGVPGELGDCTACHQGIANSGSGSVSIAFPNGLNYTPGLAQHLKVTVQDAAQQRWGFQLTARTTDPATQAGGFTPGSDRFTQVLCATNDFSCSSGTDPAIYRAHIAGDAVRHPGFGDVRV